nr:LacI family DNA-binding transcriptional regulator [Mangrovibacterium marinum]
MAEKANVSIGTVDRVIHNRGEVNPETRAKILKILEELDYRPNILASTLASKKTHTFAVLIPEVPHPEAYWSKPLKGISEAATELQQYGVVVETHYFSQANPTSFRKKAEEILKQNPEGVVFAPFFSRESIDFIAQLNRHRIPYVFIDSNMGDCNKLSFIGQNSFQCGTLAARLFDISLPHDSKILIIHFGKELDNQNHPNQREKGFLNYFEQSNEQGQKRTHTLKIENPNNPDFFTVIDREIEKLGGVNGIFVTNSQVFRIAQYLESKNMHHIRLIGHDLIQQNVEYLKTGLVDFLICQRPEEQGHRAIQTLFDHILLKKQVKRDNYTSIDIVTKENLDFYKE